MAVKKRRWVAYKEPFNRRAQANLRLFVKWLTRICRRYGLNYVDITIIAEDDYACIMAKKGRPTEDGYAIDEVHI
jgi:hypothetical protein